MSPIYGSVYDNGKGSMGREQYGRSEYGADSKKRITKVIHCLGKIKSRTIKKIQCQCYIKSRYRLSEPTIEDVYSYTTTRYMQLGCLDGPLFPFYSQEEVES